MRELALLCLNGFDGYSETKVLVIRECPKSYQIEAITRTKVAGCGRFVEAGHTAYVPKRAIKWLEQRLRS